MLNDNLQKVSIVLIRVCFYLSSLLFRDPTLCFSRNILVMSGKNISGKYTCFKVLFVRKRFLLEQVHNQEILAKREGLIIQHVPV